MLPRWKHFFVARTGQLSNQLMVHFKRIYDLKGVLNVKLLTPESMPNGLNYAI